MGNAERFNDGKLKWSLVDFNAFAPMVRVLEFGAEKYAAHNWKKGLPVTEVCESMLRHIHAVLDGEDIDPESKLPHTGHILCNGMYLSKMMENKEMDDRYVDPNQLEMFPVEYEVSKSQIDKLRMEYSQR